MYIHEIPYSSIDDEKITVTVAQAKDLKGRTAIIHNVGPNILYYSGKGTATVDSPELSVGEKMFPRTGVLNFLSAGTSVLKIEYIDPIG